MLSHFTPQMSFEFDTLLMSTDLTVGTVGYTQDLTFVFEKKNWI